MFGCVLIANRGEIAVRIARTLRRLEIESVAVYSDADAEMPHVHAADRAVRLGPSSPAESYLNIERILEAAASTGAEAIHPGYGFLSERPDFAAACLDAGLTFVGPSPETIALLGDKTAAKRAAEAAGLPVVGGLGEDSPTDAEIEQWAAGQQLPLLIKAVGGGGGRGMRVIRSLAELPEALTAARSEATAAFGDARLLIERYLEHPRHLEVQVVADRHGTVLHLGERECSLQRRHQKVIEEAPSPVVDAALRAAMCTAAVDLARACGYTGAGTVELIADREKPGEYFFLEMNARLQVEHAVTELVTGLDLIELQLRIAAGEPLSFGQEDVVLRGHAIEARVYAEDPAHGFLPSTGLVVVYREPVGVRVDSGIAAGVEIGSSYDPMLAKIIAHGDDRAAAIELLCGALAEMRVIGPTTNLAYLQALLARSEVRAGELDTTLIERLGDDVAPPSPDPELAAVALVALVATPRTDDPWDAVDGWLLAGRGTTHGLLEGPDGTLEVEIEADRDGGWKLRDGHATREAAAVRLDRADGTVRRFEAHPHGDAVWIVDSGVPMRFALLCDRASGRSGAGSLEAPMPAAVLEIRVEPGARVEEGDVLVVLESMKLELRVTSPRAGVVDQVHVVPGESVAKGQELLSLVETRPDERAKLDPA